MQPEEAAGEALDGSGAGGQRLWLRRILTVLRHPVEVFEAIRDDGDDSAGDRQEPILLIVIVAGIAWLLATSYAGGLLDERRPDVGPLDPSLIPAWAFIGGAALNNLVYWGGGALLWFGLRSTDSVATYRQARHVFAYAMAPVALSIVFVPLKLAIFGGDVFRSGGADAGAGAAVFTALELLCVAWSVALLVVGVRALHEWPWSTAAKAVLVALLVPATVIGLVLY